MIWSSGPNKKPLYAPPGFLGLFEIRELRPLEATGVQRRVIEGEGLGGFARHLTVNGGLRESFRRQQQFFWL